MAPTTNPPIWNGMPFARNTILFSVPLPQKDISSQFKINLYSTFNLIILVNLSPISLLKTMNIVIAGVGSVGTHLARMLSRQEHNITCDWYQSGKVGGTGKPNRRPVHRRFLYLHRCIKRCGSREMRSLHSRQPIGRTKHQFRHTGQKLGAKQTIARVNNSEYLETENAEYLRSIGIDSLIYPERLAAEEIVASLKQAGSRQMHEFSDGRLQLLGIKLWEKCSHSQPHPDQNGRNIRSRSIPHRSHKTAQPHHYSPGKWRTEIRRPHIRGHPSFFYPQCVHPLRQRAIWNKKYCNCRSIPNRHQNRLLAGKHYNVKIIEKDREKCIQLADKLQSTLVINGDGRDLTLLREEG